MNTQHSVHQYLIRYRDLDGKSYEDSVYAFNAMEAQHIAPLAKDSLRTARGAANVGLGLAMTGLAGKLGLKAVVGAGRLGVRAGKKVGHKLGLLKK